MSASNHAGFRRKTAVPKPVRNGFEQGADPARPTAVALFADGWALHQLWLFWLAPPCGRGFGCYFVEGAAVRRGVTAGLREQ